MSNIKNKFAIWSLRFLMMGVVILLAYPIAVTFFLRLIPHSKDSLLIIYLTYPSLLIFLLLAGFITSIISLAKIKRENLNGKGSTIFSLVVSSSIILLLLFVIFYFIIVNPTI